MYLKIQELNENIFNKVLLYFNDEYINKIKEKSTFKESLVARYLIHKSPNYNKKSFYSISHKKNLIFIWTNNIALWIDIEIIKSRDENILKSFKNREYNVIWWKSWQNFYHLWTSKESIIKLEWLLLDDISKILLTKCEQIDKTISKITFSKKMIFTYNKKEYITYSWKDWNKIFSIVY